MKKIELEKRYSPQEVESRWYRHWEEKGYFRPQSDHDGSKDKDTYVIVIPPPNVTGILHMGHALNNTIQDILIRWNRMRGRDTLWVPGTDHAGIATQNVVEKKLAKQNKTRDDLGREKFLEEVWSWKEDHGNTITNQLRRLGASCDWTRERFTMDEGLSKAVRECFVSLYEKGLIYQGDYIINWCPRCQTALSDEESEHQESQGGLYHIKYPIVGQGTACEEFGVDHIIVATTRPETMLGDTGVAINPKDERYQNLIGKKIMLPLVDREIPIITDEFVDPEFGTGMVKVTPAHDPNDFEMGNRHDLPRINVMHSDGSINDQGGAYSGMDRFEARKKVVADLEAQGLFLKKENHMHSVGHCYRCDTVVEPYLSKQWFVKMKPMAEKALAAHARGETTFYPDRWTKVYTNWLEGIRDWCISRQIWWGHQIPVWYDDENNIYVARSEAEALEEAKRKHGEEVKLRQDPDVLDTWFSSWLWPISTLGWPDEEEDLKHFYPTSDLITAPEIIFFWVARMIMSGLEFRGKVPFDKIYIHGTVRDDIGRKMSKSLGNSIDPLEVIDEMGADALRFSMIMLSAQDVYLSREKFEVGRNFTNKLWNASRFVLMNLEGFEEGTAQPNFDRASLSLSNQWILSRLDRTLVEVDKQLAQFGLAQAAQEIYHFIWNDFCDWFIELAKPFLTGEDAEAKGEVQQVLFFVLERALRILQPFAPFIAEEIWQKLGLLAKDGESWEESVMLAPWPESDSAQNDEIEADFKNLQRAVSGVRDLRAQLNIPPTQKLNAVIVPQGERAGSVFEQFQVAVERLGRVDLTIDAEFVKNSSYVANSFAEFEVFLFVEGVVNLEKERQRIEKKLEHSVSWIASLEKKLSNERFVANAPKDVVDKERIKLEDAQKVLKANQELLELFK